ncbi:MAG: hypothetical protein L6Q37_11715 [Bdellovibrionaceae bacterium]|nr:SAM-dependent DNA methyltransferase [Leptospiraceae bacterium]MCK6599023.1 hypothetical protein [Pseudobdellovibrionaceae bacterium]
MSKKIEFGDFQTPDIFANDVVNLIGKLIDKPSLVIEPTSGVGSFINAAFNLWGDQVQYRGYEINDEYYKSACSRFEKNESILVCKTDFFNTDWETIIKSEKNALVLGNPPWVTNAKLGSLNSNNLPKKNNFQKHRGFDAKTGKANFDIAEWMIIKLVQSMNYGNSLAMLCKTSTARKALMHFWKNKIGVQNAKIYTINSKEIFNVSVDACLLFLTKNESSSNTAEVYDDIYQKEYSSKFGILNNELISNLDNYIKYKNLDGFSNCKWRSGVKHDAAQVMELSIVDNKLINGFGEFVDIEDDCVYPLLKSSDLGNGRIIPRKFVIITQKNVGEDTSSIKELYPKTWNYLEKHSNVLDNRGSSIYNNRYRFSMFGVGDYSFSDYKIAISGLYKNINFIAIPPFNNKPVMVDDTCYFIPCRTSDEAALLEMILNSYESKEFLNSLIFFDSKRPITVDILKRISLSELSRIKNKYNKLHSFLSNPYENSKDDQALLVFDKKKKYKVG